MDRTYLVHVPGSYMKDKPVPLVFAFHGSGGSARIMAAFYNWVPKSDHKGFIVVFPDGVRGPGGVSAWNAGDCCGYAQRAGIDDVGFVRAMLNDMKSKFDINQSRIFATGMSNGGMFSYRLACELPDQFKAIASVAGTDNDYYCQPARPISIMHIHAMDDENVPFNGGSGKGLVGKTGYSFTSVPDTISKWVSIDKSGEAPQRVLNKPGAYCDLYADGLDGTQVKLCVTRTGGHSWPGGQKPRAASDAASTTFSATDVIWSFFSSQN